MVLVLLSACSSTNKTPVSTLPTAAAATATGSVKYYQNDGPGERKADEFIAAPDAKIPELAEPLHRFANRPYTVLGKDYVPLTERRAFVQVGIASWYGKQFHGKNTSTGEPYDMYAMTAAHPTLPLPSYARVTNTLNGRSVVVRVNDRGPFLHDRVIDLSFAAAAKIGYAQAGSAPVRIELLVQENKASPAESWYLQLAAFSDVNNATRYLNDSKQTQAQVSELNGLYRVRLGPYPSREAALEANARLLEATGKSATLVR